ncbi:putative RRN3-like protein RRN3P1 [Gracilariopsis chorda]|uniref:Putative RRN3-like protein RRN3P1 n=1 Tax=Gracilariopsis chorda TaxID=448386 RepID=A0A2V3J6Z8_9FLOR|nr:putative RRN3-like protein RRN3P1 [Gracilariopsis chorda]|eukprot:PXF50169.1 putative RRN3-like protein RRN3P1 [Gracilariopsis chorda]
MGAAVNALGHVPAHPNALKIHVALDQNANRNPLEFLRLLHALSGTNPHSITPILTGLTHHTVNLHLYPSTSPLHQLTRAALKLDLHAISPTDKTPNPALQAFVSFLTNLISAHADYIEPVFQMIVKRAFTMSAARDCLLSAMHSVVFSALHTHPRARSILLSTVQSSYPHPVRPPAEHLCFARATLRLAKEPHLVSSLLVTLFERVAAIEALVPHTVFANDSRSQLGMEAERLEVVLLELCNFFEEGGSVEAAFSAYQMFIVPMDAVRYSPYALLFGAAVAKDTSTLHDIVERLWQSFHDPCTPSRLRERFLEHAGSMVLRARCYNSDHVVRWVARLAGWLNAYIDAARGNDVIDVDIHLSFYTAVAVLLRVMTRRCEAFKDEEVLSNMRLYRIVSSGMNPFVVLPRALVDSFVETVMNTCGVDYRDVIVESEGVFPPSRTLYGSKNEFVYRIVCPDFELPRLRARLNAHVLWDDKSKASENTDNQRCGEAEEQRRLQREAIDADVKDD